MSLKKISDRGGAVSLEACIAVPIFMMMLLFFYGIMMMFSGQHYIAHALLQTGQSLSLDSLAVNDLKPDDYQSGDAFDYSEFGGARSVVTMVFSNLSSGSGSDRFSSSANWFDKENISRECGKRFIGYLANGDRNAADNKLHTAGVKESADELDFSDSYIDENGDLHLRLKYHQYFLFDMNGRVVFERKVETVSRMWNWEKSNNS